MASSPQDLSQRKFVTHQLVEQQADHAQATPQLEQLLSMLTALTRRLDAIGEALDEVAHHMGETPVLAPVSSQDRIKVVYPGDPSWRAVLSPGLHAFAGPSGAGKTTTAVELGRLVDGLVLSQDWWLLPENERIGPTVLHKYDFPGMERDIRLLLSGEKVVVTPTHPVQAKRFGTIELAPKPVILVEGVLVFFSTLIRAVATSRIFVVAPTTLRETRQLNRLKEVELPYLVNTYEQAVTKILAKRFDEDPIIMVQMPLCDILIDTSVSPAQLAPKARRPRASAVPATAAEETTSTAL